MMTDPWGRYVAACVTWVLYTALVRACVCVAVARFVPPG